MARVTAQGRTTIPKRVREAANLNAGELLSFEVQSDHLVVRKLPRADDAYLQGVSRMLDEWSSPEDEGLGVTCRNRSNATLATVQMTNPSLPSVRSNVVFEIVPPCLPVNFTIRKQYLPDAVGILDRDRLSLA